MPNLRCLSYDLSGKRYEGRVIGASNIIRDITDRKRTETQLAEREAQLAMFVEHAPAVIAMFDDKMRYLATSRRYVSDFRLPPDIELIGRSHYEIFPDIPPRWREVHARVLAGETWLTRRTLSRATMAASTGAGG
jgi:PAS domain-containing protein